jgi:hypothetical protein
MSPYDDYKKDSDQFHGEREQHERELREADTWERLVELLESRGVNIDEFASILAKLKKGYDRLGLDDRTQRDLTVKMLKLRLGWSMDDLKNEEPDGL